jgi:peptide/nickel transport system permease protein
MLRFILRRIAVIPVALLLVNFLGYAYAHLVLPIRAARIPYLASLPDPGPLLPAYGEYLQGALHLDFGPLPGTELTLGEVILTASKASAGLLAIALTLSIVLGLSLGLWAVKVEPRRIARWLTLLTTTGLAMPSFYIGSLLLLATFYWVLQRGGDMIFPLSGFGWDLHLVLPTLALLARPTVQIAQMTAGLLETELGKRYIRTARSIGHLWQVIRRRHALRNIMAPVVLSIAASARLLMGELILVEWLFQWPGLGNLFAQALVPAQVMVRGFGNAFVFLNPPVVATVLTAFAAFFLLIDLVAAVLVRVLDPRLRAPEEGVGAADVISTQSGVRRRNWSLLIGGAIVFLIVVVAILGPSLAPQDPLEEHKMIQVEDGWEKAPFPIFTVPGFPLGSDERGRDLLSRLLWAVRPTMVMVAVVALVRLVLGTMIGLTAGWSTGRLGRLLDGLIGGGLAVPILMVALAAIAAVGLEVGVAAFIIGLSVTGWAETARIVREQTRLVRGQQYVEAAQALGLSDGRIMVQHVLRQIMPMVWMLLALEIAGTLMATAGLGFLGYYVGGDIWIEVEDWVTRRISGMPELGQMLATANTGVTSLRANSLPWGMVAVGSTVFTIVLGFNLMAAGLRQQLSLETARRRTVLTKIADRMGAWYHDSPLYALGGWLRRHWPRIAAAGAVLIVAIGAGAIWWRAQATKQSEVLGGVLEVPGGQFWAAEAYDPYGTRSVGVAGPADPKVLWRFSDPAGFAGGPAVSADGTIYIASRAAKLYALDANGDLQWEVKTTAGGVGTPALNAQGEIHVADREGGLSVYAPDGTLIWRFQSEAGDLATTGPVVAPDGMVYYGLGSIVQAVSPEGEGLWTAQTPAFHRTLAPWLSPESDLLFWQDVALATQDGSAVEMGIEEEVDEYLTGADGLTYLRVGHNVSRWEMTPSGAVILETTRWDPRSLGTLTSPTHAGVTPERVVWVFYTNPYEASRIAWLDPTGRVLGARRVAYGRGMVIAFGPESTVYLCGSEEPRGNPAPSCIALVRDSDDPLWQVPLGAGERVQGGAVVQDRLYVVANLVTMKEGSLVALGDEGAGKADATSAPEQEVVVAEVSPTPEPASGAPEATEPVTETAPVEPLDPSASETVTVTAVPAASEPQPIDSTAVTATAELAEPPTGQPVHAIWHTVQTGETPDSIARRYGTTWAAIVKTNNLVDPNQIYVGQKLKIPISKRSTGGTTPVCRLRHTVVQGESIWQIAGNYGASPYDVMRANGLTFQTARTLQPGTLLCIP